MLQLKVEGLIQPSAVLRAAGQMPLASAYAPTNSGISTLWPLDRTFPDSGRLVLARLLKQS